jgi:hypothetical protein
LDAARVERRNDSLGTPEIRLVVEGVQRALSQTRDSLAWLGFGALDAAITNGFDCGGWMPGDRMAEDGVISDRYPLTPLPHGNYEQRTRLNVVDSDGSALLYDGSLSGGTRLTHDLCKLSSQPCLLIDARDTPDPIAAAQALLQFIKDNKIETLNVAGPRASGWPAGYHFSAAVIGEVISRLPNS